MNLECQKCGCEFEHAITIGYCDECREAYRKERQERAERKTAAEVALGAVCITGKWGDPKESPQSVYDAIGNRNVCGMCGSDELECSYGFAGGFGLGSYSFCLECFTVQDFHEDLE